MAAFPPNPWFPTSNHHPPSGGGGGRRRSGEIGRYRKGTHSSPYHLIASASALRLGDYVRLRCTNHLHLLLCIHSQEGFHSDNLPSINDIWSQRTYFLKKYSLLETLADTLSTSCSSCFSFFNGNDSGKDIVDKHGKHHKSSTGNSGRLWTNVIIALNILVYAAQFATQGRLTLLGAKVNSLIDKGQLWRLATSSFMHANIGHLMVNCYSLNSIGPAVEQLSGPRRFMAIYCVSAIASSLMSYRFCESPAVGASGAIFGLVGSYAVFVLRHRRLFGGGKQDLQQIARVIVLNMAIGLLSRGIDNWGHLGGLLGGAAMSWFLGPAWEYEPRRLGGGSIFVDRAPIFRLVDRKRR